MKKLIAIFAITVAACGASASELYWMVNTTEANKLGEWDTAKLWVAGTDAGYAQNITGSNSGPALSSMSREELADFDGWVEDISKYSGKSFFIELTKADERVGATDVISYSALTANSFNGGMQSPSSPYTATSFTTQTVPEPTSGLLILLGMGALALRRRRA